MSRKGVLLATACAAWLLGAFPLSAGKSATDPVLAGFQDPPQSARPRVWWHWMNGNITEDGIAKDLAWMRRVGIAGMHNFDAALVSPQVVENRLAYMSPEWKQAFRMTAARAKQDGLELGIAASPGWSQTGGPWVPPEDGIKKVVWSETVIEGGRRFDSRLAAPPRVTGPYQSLPAEGVFGLAREGGAAPEAYRDIAVLAVPVRPLEPVDAGDFRDGNGRRIDRVILTDGRYEDAVDLGVGTPSHPVVLSVEYREPREIRSASLFVHDARPSFFDHYFTPVLEARVDGRWQRVATFELAAVPTTVAFSPVRASAMRVVFSPFIGPLRPSQGSPVPGVVVPDFIAPVSGPHTVKVAEFRVSQRQEVDRFEAKAGFSLVRDYHALPTSAPGNEQGTHPDQVVDLTARMASDGTLDWTPPAGHWRIFRFGWSLTGKTNHPASPEATGLEVDKLDGAAVERYLRHYLDMYRDVVGSELFGRQGVQVLMNDSTEVEAFNWTPRMIERFRELRGYDPTPWLPTIAGAVIGTRDETDRFLYDFRRTISELHASEHYATLARVAHDYGLRVYGEALEDQRPVLGDDMSMRRHADVPMAAIWVWNDELGPRPTLLGDMKGASSVAHLYGRKVVAAESLTSALAPWANAPSDLRKIIDLAFVHGINQPVIHTSVHQPLDDKVPGLSLMIFGQFFNRHETWAEMAKPWVDYLSRASFLLQQGTNVADVAYFHGEEAPITAITAFAPPNDLPTRYAYDYVNAEALRDVLTVRDGDLVAASGARYRVLYLGPGARRMTLPTLRRIAALAADGATVVGHPPKSSPSLSDNAGEYARLVGRLWSGSGETQVGKGRVIETRDVESALARVGVLPDVEIEQAAERDSVMFVHRRLDDGDLYFLVNRSARAQALDVRFRVFGKAPDAWHADTGKIVALNYRQEAAGTRVPITLGPQESRFVLFRRASSERERAVKPSPMVSVADLAGTWSVSFQGGRGAPESPLQLDVLGSLSDHADPRVRYFSGIATYTIRFTLPEEAEVGEPLWLDLGQVGDLAEVEVNGQVVGSPWHAPYRVDIGGAAKPGENQLAIRVANTWINRLIGDAQPDATKVAFVTIPTYSADAPLRPSGLIGPVRLLIAPGGE